MVTTIQPKLDASKRVDEQIMKTGKYQISKDIVFAVTIHLREKDGRWLIASGPKGAETHSVVFRMWTYDEMIEMRKKATTYDASKRMHMLDNDTLNRLKVQSLLVSWTFDRDNPNLKIHHVNGVMTDESWAAFASLQPNIASFILDEINKVYEFNG